MFAIKLWLKLKFKAIETSSHHHHRHFCGKGQAYRILFNLVLWPCRLLMKNYAIHQARIAFTLDDNTWGDGQ
jgi:hypothetical protein